MIIATAGHVDHGKTSLIAALTGVDTDRLPEERKRGMSIDLGFAYMPMTETVARPQPETLLAVSVPSVSSAAVADTLGFIDVPGHEKFVRNMIAGVGSVDLALLVIAADDGPMPQTQEHLAILQLLGVRELVVVVTKTDLVEPTRLEQVSTEIGQLLDDTPYKNCQMFAVSTVPGDGGNSAINELKAFLVGAAQRVIRRRGTGYFRLAIDRSFTITGAGTVVTGTVVSGSVHLEDTLTLLSDNRTVRVRGIHAQNKQASMASVGERCALNLSGSELRKATLVRGDWITSCATMRAVSTLDVTLTPVQSGFGSASRAGNSLAHWTSAHLHLGAASVPCRIALLDSESLALGQSGLARLICDRPLGAVFGDRFVLRDQSARYTIAGGSVLDPLPPRRGRSKPERLKLLGALQQPDAGLALQHLLEVSPGGVNLRQFSASGNLPEREIDQLVADHAIVNIEATGERWGLTNEHWQSLLSVVEQSLGAWHTAHPHALGADQDQLMRAMPERIAVTVFRHAVTVLHDNNALVRQAAVYRLPEWQVSLAGDYEQQWQQVEPLMVRAGSTAPRVVEIAELLQQSADEVIGLLNACVAHGRLYRVSPNRYYLPEILQQLASLGESLAGSDNFTVAAYRDQSGIGRNLVIELLEFFDRVQFTRRMGQKRLVLQSAASVFGA